MRRALFLVLAAGCTRAPAEDFPAHAAHDENVVVPAAQSAVLTPASSPVPSVAASAAPRPPERCIRETPAAPPPPVPAGPAAGCPADPEGGPPKVPVVRVAFTSRPEVSATLASVDAELVASEHDTMRGLMYRKSMPEDRGMLFNLHTRDDHQFWMHNTCIPLDLLYIDEDGLIAGIVENAPTLDDNTRGVGCPSRYVLEVNAGWSRRHGIKAGQHAVLPAMP